MPRRQIRFNHDPYCGQHDCKNSIDNSIFHPGITLPLEAYAGPIIFHLPDGRPLPLKCPLLTTILFSSNVTLPLAPCAWLPRESLPLTTHSDNLATILSFIDHFFYFFSTPYVSDIVHLSL